MRILECATVLEVVLLLYRPALAIQLVLAGPILLAALFERNRIRSFRPCPALPRDLHYAHRFSEQAAELGYRLLGTYELISRARRLFLGIWVDPRASRLSG
ncbi:MAG: hypothetical protein U0166_26670 [Acidobacteriota bacterium]